MRPQVDIEFAIRNRKLLQFTYDGFNRLVEPHTYGIDGKGHFAIRAYQVSGGSESGEYVGWKLFHVAEIRSGIILDEQFPAPRNGYKRGDKWFSQIIVEL